MSSQDSTDDRIAEGERRAAFFKKPRTPEQADPTNVSAGGRKGRGARAAKSEGYSSTVEQGGDDKPLDRYEALLASRDEDGGGDVGAFAGNTSNDLAKRLEYRERSRVGLVIPKKVKNDVNRTIIEVDDEESWTSVVLEGLRLVGESRGIKELAEIPDWKVLNRNNR